MHSDNLGSTDAVTNASGTPVQMLDYYPYGSSRIASSTAGTDEKHKYIGQFADASGLSYLNARYYDSSRGQFLTEDPVFLSVGNPNQVQQLTGENTRTYLSDPQQFNSYSYGKDNPIKNMDPSGNGLLQGTVSFGWWLGGGTFSSDIDTSRLGWQIELGPSIGPSLGGRFSGSYDPNGSLDLAGPYFQVSAGATLGVGANYSSEAPLVYQDGRFKADLPPGKFTLAFGLYAGGTDSVVYKNSPTYYGGNGFSTQSTQSTGSALPGYITSSQLSSAVVSYANSPGANTKDSNFAAALFAINMQSAPWLSSQSMSASTPSTIHHQ